MFRYKALIGSSVRAQTLPAQKTETKVGCSVLNRMARLGMPVSQRVVEGTLGLGLYVHDLNCASKPRRPAHAANRQIAATTPQAQEFGVGY